MSNTYNVASNKRPPAARVASGTTAEIAAYTGAEGEITLDDDTGVFQIHDGSTAGGTAVSPTTLDGVIIGGTTPAAATVTDFTASGTSLFNTETVLGPTGGAVVSIKATAAYGEAITIQANGDAASWARADWVNIQASGSGILYYDQAGNFVMRNDSLTGYLAFQIASGTEAARFTNTGNLGIGTTSPDGKLHVHSGSAGSVTATADADELVVEGSGNTGISILAPDANNSLLVFGMASDNYAAQLCYIGSLNQFRLGTDIAGGVLDFYVASNAYAARIDTVGNLLIGGTATPTSSVGNLVLFNGTVPSASVTDGVVLYSEDVTASAELKVRDEAGNVTTLSPHNFSLIPDGPSEDMAWGYYSERDGKAINVDLLAVIRAVESLAGETFVHQTELAA